MIYNLNEIKNDPFKDQIYDVCIVGSGFAGITLALNLHKELNVLLLEAGDMEYSSESQEIYEGKNIGQEYWSLADCRGRWFGGTSDMWGGWCGALESQDFEKKDHIKFSGWPISKNDLDPYYDKTIDIFGPKKSGWKPTKGWDNVLKRSDKDFDHFQVRLVQQDYFKNIYGQRVKERTNIHCYLNANLTDMTLSADLSNVETMEIQNYKKQKFTARAKITILAAGGLENPRLLLSFNKQCSSGIGNNNDLVGRFFCEHPQFELGKILIEDDLRESSKSSVLSNFKFLTPTKKFIAEEKISNFGIKVLPKSYIENDREEHFFKETVRDIICSSAWTRDLASKIRGSKLYCFDDSYEVSDGIFDIESEQIPNLSSRVILGSNVDYFGMERINLDWRFSDTDKRTMKHAALRFAKMFARRDLGRVKIDDWVLSDNLDDIPGFPHRVGGPHHMCTTRMSSTPKDGVVDKNQKVFGIDNLYIAGSSVFSTTGYINPTFTIVQMSLRLADHIKEKFDYRQT